MTSRRSEDRKKPATGCCIFLEKASVKTTRIEAQDVRRTRRSVFRLPPCLGGACGLIRWSEMVDCRRSQAPAAFSAVAHVPKMP
uniref:Uncharacterized protein n=1 Tax=Salix viminalis TaxID=40686 RepID=A0A6N2NGW2_SALVM